MSTLARVARNARRRLYSARFVARLGMALAWAMVLVLVLVVFGKFVPLGLRWWWLPIVGCVVSVVVSVAELMRTRVSALKAAAVLDQRLKLNDRIATGLAFEQASEGDPYTWVAVEDADRIAAVASVRNAVPIVLGRAWWLATGALVCVIAVGMFVPAQDVLGNARAAREAAERQRRQIAMDNLKAAAEAIAPNASPDEPEQDAAHSRENIAIEQEQLRALREIERELASGTMTSEEAGQKAAQTVAQAAQQRQAEAEQLKKDADRLRDLLNAPASSPEEEALRQAAKSGDMTQAAQAARELLTRKASAQGPEQAAEIQRLANDLREMEQSERQDALAEGPDKDSARPDSAQEPLTQEKPAEQVKNDAGNKSPDNAQDQSSPAETNGDRGNDSQSKQEPAQEEPSQQSPHQQNPTSKPDTKQATPTQPREAMQDGGPEGEQKPRSNPQQEQSAGDQRKQLSKDQAGQKQGENNPKQGEKSQESSGEQQGQNQRDAGRRDQQKQTDSRGEQHQTGKDDSGKPNAGESELGKDEASKENPGKADRGKPDSGDKTQADERQEPSNTAQQQRQQPQTRPGNTPGKQPGEATGERPDGEALQKVAERLERQASKSRAESERLAKQAQEMYERMSPEQRRELQEAARRAGRPGQESKPDGGSDQAGDRPGQHRPRVPNENPPARTEVVDARGKPSSRPDAPPGSIAAEWLGEGQREPGEPSESRARSYEQAAKSAEKAIEDRAVPKRFDRLIERYFRRLPENVNQKDAGSDSQKDPPETAPSPAQDAQ